MNNLIKRSDRFFVAGSRGMAGSAICRALLEKGYGNPNNGGALLTPSREELDLLNAESVNSWYKTHKPDIVVLAAAKVGGIFANDNYPADFLLENLKIQTNVIEGAWRAGVRRLLFLGSSCIYPKFTEQPIREESLMTGALEPTNEWYATAKICGIKLCESLRQQYGFDAISLMPTNLYGPGDNYHPKNSHVLPALIRRFHEAKQSNAESVTCWGTGSPLREFLHVDDLGSASLMALETWDPNSDKSPKTNLNEILTWLNVGTGIDITVRELASEVAKAVNFKGQILWDNSKPDGTPKKQLNIEKIKMLGWEPKIKLSEGLKDTYYNFKTSNVRS